MVKMKYIFFISFLILPIIGQVTLDSSQVSRLLYKLDSLAYMTILDSLNNIELKNKDTIISNKDRQINNLNFIINNLEIDKQWLKSEIIRLKVEAESKWGLLEYGGVGVLLIIIGILGGMQL